MIMMIIMLLTAPTDRLPAQVETTSCGVRAKYEFDVNALTHVSALCCTRPWFDV